MDQVQFTPLSEPLPQRADELCKNKQTPRRDVRYACCGLPRAVVNRQYQPWRRNGGGVSSRATIRARHSSAAQNLLLEMPRRRGVRGRARFPLVAIAAQGRQKRQGARARFGGKEQAVSETGRER